MKRILVSMNDLLDTRLGLCTLLNPEVALRWATGKDLTYFNRLGDYEIYKALGITKEEWDKNYYSGNELLMKSSVMTNVPQFIMNLLYKHLDTSRINLVDFSPRLDVNLYPYQLNEEEKETLRLILQDYIPMIESVNFVNYSLEEIDYSLLDVNYEYFIIYDFYKWSEIHGKEFRDKFLQKTVVFAPKLLHQDLNKVELTKEQIEILKLDPFKMIETALNYRFKIHFVDPNIWEIATFNKESLPEEDLPVFKDLDQRFDPSESYTPDDSRSDLRYQFPQG